MSPYIANRGVLKQILISKYKHKYKNLKKDNMSRFYNNSLFGLSTPSIALKYLLDKAQTAQS